MAEVLEHGRLRKSALGAEKGDLERLFLRQARRHDFAEQAHDLFVPQRSRIALERPAQHLRLALGAVEIDRVAVAVFGYACLLCQTRALVDERVQLLIDRIDPRAQARERAGRWRGGARGRLVAAASTHRRISPLPAPGAPTAPRRSHATA